MMHNGNRWCHNTHRASLPYKESERGRAPWTLAEYGPPVGTALHSAEKLSGMGMVGVYPVGNPTAAQERIINTI